MRTRRAIAPVVCGIAAVALIAGLGPVTLAAGDAEGPSLAARLWRFVGIFHPLVVHFPIALLTLAAIVELMRLKYREISPHITLVCLIIAAAGSIPAVVFGWARAETYTDSAVLTLHRWMGIGLTGLTVTLAVVAFAAHRRPASAVLRRLQTAGVFIAAGLVAFVGHLGAELTHGEAFVGRAWTLVTNPPVRPATREEVAAIREIKPWDSPLQPVTPTPVEVAHGQVVVRHPSGGESAAPVTPRLAGGAGSEIPPALPLQRIDFLTQVLPIFQKHCVECHGPNKAKAKLRLDTKDEALAWRNSDGQPLWVPGRVGDSYLLKIIGPDADEADKMPPLDPNNIVTEEAYELIRRWIAEGAEWPVLPGA
jgi:uncharacterized membrane protein/mono/diheme cytochrome c family protein